MGLGEWWMKGGVMSEPLFISCMHDCASRWVMVWCGVLSEPIDHEMAAGVVIGSR